MLPQAREDKLVVRHVGPETVVYDKERHRAHRLNRTSALVWSRCNGATDLSELSLLLQRELGLPEPDEDLVWLTLRRLERAHLMKGRLTPPSPPGVSRREAMRQAGFTAAKWAMLLPVVTTILAPSPAQAASPVATCEGAFCTTNADCKTGCRCYRQTICIKNTT